MNLSVNIVESIFKMDKFYVSYSKPLNFLDNGTPYQTIGPYKDKKNFHILNEAIKYAKKKFILPNYCDVAIYIETSAFVCGLNDIEVK